MALDPLGFLLRVAREHGALAQFRLPGMLVYLVNDPDLIDRVLLAEHENLVKDSFTRELALVTGNGLLTSEGAFWRKQRRLSQPAFHHQRVQAYGETMVRYAERLASSYGDGEVRDVHEDMMRLTLSIVGKTLFSVEVDDEARVIRDSIEVMMDRFSGANAFVPRSLPTPGNLRALAALKRLDAIVYRIIDERRRTGDTGDLLSMLMVATSEDGARMTDRQLRDEAITLLLAGHETTALTLTFALHLLGAHPEIEAGIARNVLCVLGNRPATVADLPELRPVENVVRESMRLFPPAWAIGREAIAPFELGGYPVARGTQLWISQWVVHRDPRHFEEPDAFFPERWSGDLAKRLPRYAYFPFGGGPRVCIGNAFAMMEATLVLATLVRHVRMSPEDLRPLELNPAVTLRPKKAVRMRVQRRT
jgi:cytochrome P450